MKRISVILLIVLGLLISWICFDRRHKHGLIRTGLEGLEKSPGAHGRHGCLAVLQGEMQRLDQLVNNWACCD